MIRAKHAKGGGTVRRGIWRLAIVTCIAASTLSSSGAVGQENGGLATIENLHYDRTANSPGVAVNWNVDPPNGPTAPYRGRVVFRETVTTLELVPGLTDQGGSGGGAYNMQLTGHGVTGLLGRSDQGTIDRTLAGYYRACPSTCIAYAEFWCDGTYARRELILTITLDCILARLYVGTPPFSNPHIEATVVLVPSGAKPLPLPPKMTYTGLGAFTVS
jgi:hypothetical protein